VGVGAWIERDIEIGGEVIGKIEGRAYTIEADSGR
jgi:hypothetical protein